MNILHVFHKWCEARHNRRVAKQEAAGRQWALDALARGESVGSLDARTGTSLIHVTGDYYGRAFDRGVQGVIEVLPEHPQS